MLKIFRVCNIRSYVNLVDTCIMYSYSYIVVYIEYICIFCHYICVFRNTYISLRNNKSLILVIAACNRAYRFTRAFDTSTYRSYSGGNRSDEGRVSSVSVNATRECSQFYSVVRLHRIAFCETFSRFSRGNRELRKSISHFLPL